jgi:hypothetical protein
MGTIAIRKLTGLSSRRPNYSGVGVPEQEHISLETKPFAHLVGEEVVNFLCEHLPTKVRTRFGRALDHYARAGALVGVDEEMGMIRLVAAEEELVVGIFELLKIKQDQFPEHKDFVRKFKNHIVKLSFYPVLQQFKFAIGYMLKEGFVLEGIEDLMRFRVKPVVDGKAIRVAVLKEDGTELIRHDPFDVSVSRTGVENKDIVPLMLAEFEEEVNKQQGGSLKTFISKRADYRNLLLYANDAATMGFMEDKLADLLEMFKQTYRDLLWVLATVLGAKPPSVKWGIASQFIALYREVLIEAGVLKSDNTPAESETETADEAHTSEIIEVMARADVNYFWVQGGKRFEAFDKSIASGVRKRMRAIHAALEGAGYKVRKSQEE